MAAYFPKVILNLRSFAIFSEKYDQIERTVLHSGRRRTQFFFPFKPYRIT
jgi:hypothetical protein